MSPAERLHSGLIEMGQELPYAAEQKLIDFLGLLAKWNRTYNLTGVRDEDHMVSRHLLDALSVIPLLDGVASLADVGSGAGLPGIPLAIARPELRVASIEANQKKIAFQQQAKIELKLENVSIHCCRIAEFKGDKDFDAVISRAFSELGKFVRTAADLVPGGCKLLAMKGRIDADEIGELPAGWKVERITPLNVPGSEGERNLITIKRA